VEVDVEFKRYEEQAPFPFGTLSVRDMTPGSFTELSLGVVEVPIGGEHPPFAEQRKEKTYVGLRGIVQFTAAEQRVLLHPGDVLVFDDGEQYSYHNGGYEPAQLLVIQRPGRERQKALEESGG
jgi:mannose-6-phosphate isomerase-like protein (cupin superfamily)